MTFTSPTDDIILQEGTMAFDYTASGTVYKGQAVCVNKDGLYVAAAPGATSRVPCKGCVGIAAYDQTTGKPVAVFGQGNICRAISSGGTVQAGTPLYCGVEGKLMPGSKFDGANICNPSGLSFMALEDVSTADETVKVLIY